MSGYKRATVNISQDEYDRLREADRKLRSLPNPSEMFFDGVARRSSAMLQENVSQVAQRQSNFEQMVLGLDNNVRTLEATTNQALYRLEEQTVSEVQNYAGCLWDHFDQVITNHANAFQEQIAVEHERYQQELFHISRNMRQMTHDYEQKVQLAQNWLEAARAFCIYIEDNYSHEIFAPGQVARLKQLLEQTQDNMELGLSEVVIVSAQRLYTAFSELRIDLEQQQNEWQLLYQTAWEACSQILGAGESSKVVQAVDLDGNLLNYTINVLEWSQELPNWLANVDTIKQQLESLSPFPDSETLRQWLQVDFPGLYQALQGIVLDARVNALNSQLRINIADLVVRALQEQGFALEASDYEASDMRNAYQMRLCNLEGNEVVVKVSPTGSDLGANELHLQSHDAEIRTEHELERRWFEVSRSLSHYGLEVGQYVREDAGEYHPVRTNEAFVSQDDRRTRHKHYLGNSRSNGNRTHSPGISEG